MTEPSLSAVELAVQARIAAARRREAEKKRQREELAAARAAGLGYRHAARLRNAARSPQDPADVTETVTTVGQSPKIQPDRGETPTVTDSPEETPVPAALRPAHCPACRRERPARLTGTVTVNGTRYEVLKCLDTGCGLQWLARPGRPRTARVAA